MRIKEDNEIKCSAQLLAHIKWTLYSGIFQKLKMILYQLEAFQNPQKSNHI